MGVIVLAAMPRELPEYCLQPRMLLHQGCATKIPAAVGHRALYRTIDQSFFKHLRQAHHDKLIHDRFGNTDTARLDAIFTPLVMVIHGQQFPLLA